MINDLVIFRPDGLYSLPVPEWNSSEEYLDNDKWIKYLNNDIQIEDDPTLLDLFSFINKTSPEKLEIINMLFGHDISALLADLSAPSEDSYNISHLEIAHFTELFKPTHGEPWFVNDFEFYGTMDNIKYVINMIPNNLLADIPIKLLKMSKLCIVDWNNKEENSFEFKTRITLREFLNVIINEITFYGSNDEKIRLAETVSKPRKNI